jgi:plastocyanin
MIAPGMLDLHAGEIRGKVSTLGGDSKAPARYVVRGQSPSSTSATPTGQIAVALEFLDTSPTIIVTDSTFVMAQQNTAFVPNLLVVPVGARVTFPNRDAFFHNVFSYSPPRSFDLGRYPKGETRTVRFNESGIVRIFCEIHASMYATILVSPSDHYQIINSLDGFSFPQLPAGRYRVVAVDASGRKAKQDIEIKGDESATLSLTLE